MLPLLRRLQPREKQGGKLPPCPDIKKFATLWLGFIRYWWSDKWAYQVISLLSIGNYGNDDYGKYLGTTSAEEFNTVRTTMGRNEKGLMSSSESSPPRQHAYSGPALPNLPEPVPPSGLGRSSRWLQWQRFQRYPVADLMTRHPLDRERPGILVTRVQPRYHCPFATAFDSLAALLSAEVFTLWIG